MTTSTQPIDLTHDSVIPSLSSNGLPHESPHDEVTEAALAVLAQSSISELRFLRVDQCDGEICLTGRVRSFYHKQLAQEAVRPVAAGRQVVNRVDVCVS